MPKIKTKQKSDEKNYFYEILGILFCLISLIILGRLGKAGIYLNLILKIIFGDYAILLLIFLFFLGLLGIIKKRFINFRHIAFIGLIFIYLGVSMLAHLSIYDALLCDNSNITSETFNLYKNYFSNYEVSYITGGGVIGCLVMQLNLFLFGKTGMIVISIIFIIIGICFMFQTNIFEKLFKGNHFKNIIKKSFFMFKSYFTNIETTKKYNPKRKYFFGLNILQDIPTSENFILQSQINKEVALNLEKFISINKINAVFSEQITSFSSSRFIIKLDQAYDVKLFKEQMNDFFSKKCFIYKKNNNYYIDVPNQFKELLTAKRLYTETIKDDGLAVGYEVNKEILRISLEDTNAIFLIGDYGSGIRSFIKSLIVQIFLKYQFDVKILFNDNTKSFDYLDFISNELRYLKDEKQMLEYLEEEFMEYERRVELFKFLDVETLDKANENINAAHPNIKKLYPYFNIFYLDYEKISNDLIMKINFLIKFGFNVGMYSIIVVRDKESISKLQVQNSKAIFFKTEEILLSLKMLGNDLSCYLQKKGDILFLDQNELYHGQTPYLSESDFQNFIKRLIS